MSIRDRFREGHKKIVKAIDLKNGADVTKHITPNEDFVPVITINSTQYIAKNGKTKKGIELHLEDSQGNKEVKWVARADDFKKHKDNE